MASDDASPKSDTSDYYNFLHSHTSQLSELYFVLFVPRARGRRLACNRFDGAGDFLLRSCSLPSLSLSDDDDVGQCAAFSFSLVGTLTMCVLLEMVWLLACLVGIVFRDVG